MTQEEVVLETLRRDGSRTTWGLAREYGIRNNASYAPEPSIRRAIRNLRQRGYDIVSENGTYHLNQN